jgi:polar amino acid transport system substrate-binding protein
VVLFDDRFDYYLALNPHLPNALVSRLQAALDEIRQHGGYEALRKKYLE